MSNCFQRFFMASPTCNRKCQRNRIELDIQTLYNELCYRHALTRLANNFDVDLVKELGKTILKSLTLLQIPKVNFLFPPLGFGTQLTNIFINFTQLVDGEDLSNKTMRSLNLFFKALINKTNKNSGI
ncbi:hypothetical protein IMG5_077970 [Ichthyophthirius multifiliis]|uniref:Uncharacterized protein n=1 Tax=Ichthyophthirius multifiliis TaxID=5932 RepID=G0QQF1_ICHMU|nr:hypothetical protein IMG5_077970 [Ichthyophthirius multifiliis]EGR32560.1 hypothetical protein IMG5_077970 [Ichthyophthirius multifiliis]|eukprot:XP_004036546.1 hypothetical protein IMG5_077970 [Ichthyophthirius multifiliis]